MLSAITYYLDRLRSPDASDFISMGLGIEARYRRAARAWEPHLRLSREFVEQSLRELPSTARIAVLGAGRLFDVPVVKLRGVCSELHLFDADPGCRRTWRKVSREGARIVPHIIDLTGSLVRWTEVLRREMGRRSLTPQSLARRIDGLSVDKKLCLENFDLVISLNLLSQIPIYWRDRAEKIVGAQFAEHPLIVEALRGTYERLQRGHMDLLADSGASRIVVISDRRFFYYRNDTAPWQEEESLYLDSLDLLKYVVHRSDSWYWHIIPQGIEEPDYGSIHDVRAIEFRRG